MFLVKLGGSMITYKADIACEPYRWKEIDLHYRIRRDRIIEAGRAIQGHLSKGMLIVHGGGTHGHRTVRRWREGIVKGSQEMMVWEVKWRMTELSSFVIKVLGECGVPAVEVAPSDIAIMDGRRIKKMDTSAIKYILERKGVPILRGDMAPNTDGGWSIISGDEILEYLSGTDLGDRIDKVIMCMEEEGIFDGFGGPDQKLIGYFDPRREEPKGDGDGSDETGGVSGKIKACRSIADKGVPAQIIGGDIAKNLDMALKGEKTGTLFPA